MYKDLHEMDSRNAMGSLANTFSLCFLHLDFSILVPNSLTGSGETALTSGNSVDSNRCKTFGSEVAKAEDEIKLALVSTSGLGLIS